MAYPKLYPKLLGRLGEGGLTLIGAGILLLLYSLLTEEIGLALVATMLFILAVVTRKE